MDNTGLNSTNRGSHIPQINFPIEEKKSEIQQILQTQMTRDRDLERVKKNLPGLEKFIQREKKHSAKRIIELGSGEGLLADDIQNTYGIKVSRVDKYRNPEQNNNTTVEGGREITKFDIRNFEKFPGPIDSVYSLYTLQYTHNAPDIIGHIYDKLKLHHCAYLQFPRGFRSRKIIDEFKKQNTGKENIRITWTQTDMIIELLKNENNLTIPKYQSINGLTKTGKDNKPLRNSKLFYQYLSEDNDPERKDIQERFNEKHRNQFTQSLN